jgi:tetratricopeptide (TPR) repeat protein
MERREVLLKCLGGAELALAPSKVLPATGTGNGRTREFYELWEEACLSHYWFEDKRAYDLCLRALALAAENLESSKRADIIEKLACLRESLEVAEEDLARQCRALKAEPQNPEKHCYLGFTLTRLGREEEATAEYRLALENPEGLCAHCYRDSWNNIGWYYYRQGMYHAAVQWFERVCQLNDTGEFLQHYDRARAIENKMQNLLRAQRPGPLTAAPLQSAFQNLPFRIALASMRAEESGPLHYNSLRTSMLESV